MKKKNIEELFQEKLGDYSQLPEEHVWENITASLDKKRKKRRIIPIWWKLGSVAAVLLIAFYFFRGPQDLPNGTEIITKAPNTNAIDKQKIPGASATNAPDTTKITGTEIENVLTKISEENTDEGSSLNDVYTGEAIEAKGVKEDVPAMRNTEVNTAVAAKQEKGDFKGNKDNKSAVLPALSEVLVQKKEMPAINTSGNDAVNPGLKSSDTTVVTVAIAESAAQKKDDFTLEKEVIPEQKASIFDAIAAQEEINEKEAAADKWTVGPRIAPVFFSSLSQGSPIHSSFENNAKSGNVNLSYGLALSYNLSKRLKVRSGVHKVDFGYDTRDVSFSSSLNAATNGIIDNIDYSLTSRNLVVRSNTRSGKIASENALDVSGPDPSLNGKMIQEFGYLEVPLELTYQILDKKFGVNVIGGVSSLFLVNNSVMLESNGIATEMGEANNLNDLNMSTNFGVGITYQLNTSLQLSLEPMFKYQLNTFSEAAGNFQPFSMGVYSGLNFRF